MPSAPSAPPQKESRSWFWTSLGMAGLILLCCGIGPFVVITIIDIARDSSSEGAGKGSVMARASHAPTPRASAPQNPRPSASGTPHPGPSLTPLPGPDAPEEPAPQAAPQVPAPHVIPAPPPAQPQIPAPQVDPLPPQVGPLPPQVAPPESAPPAPGQSSSSPAPASDGRIGEVVRDGQLEFVVREVKCGLKQIGTDPRVVQTQGQFCVVTISVRNVGDRPQTLFEMEQKGFGANGSEYSSHSIASLLANEPDNTDWLGEISPGGEVVGSIVYDLPEGVDLSQLELNDPTVPGGVKVVLR
jgi:hypothetical protein